MSAPQQTIRIDLRTLLPVVALAVVVLAIIFVELCGREGVEPLGEAPEPVDTATLGPTFTPGPSPTLAPDETPEPTPGPQPGGEDRDAVRVNDLAAVQQALEQYRDEHGEYPDNDLGIQTLCSFDEFDVGCELEEFLDPLPEDPLGSEDTNGYWYSSDGQTYVLYAQRESETIPECATKPDHLQRFETVYCVNGP